MEPPNAKRNKKADKAKEKRDKFGAFSSKHIRIQEALQAKKPKAPKQ